MEYINFLSNQSGHNLTLINYLLILIISFLSNLFSALAGGGAGLIQLPALLLFGIPYYKALAVHKIATVALGLGGSLRNFLVLKNNLYLIFQLLFFGIPGVIIGASLVNIFPEEYLYFLLATFSIAIGFYSINKPYFGLKAFEKKINIYTKLRFYFLVFVIGVLNGSISSGTGLLVTILLIKTYGVDFLTSISITFLTVGIFWNAVGAIALSRIGSLPIMVLILLLIGSFLGGLTGAHLSNLKGNIFIKKLFTLLCFLIGISLFLKNFI